MLLKLIYPRWGSAHIPWNIFFTKLQVNDYHGVEMDLPLGTEKVEILSQLKSFNLDFVGQHWETKETDFNKHKDKLKCHLYNLAENNPLFINSQTGMDFFTFSQNAELLLMADDIEKETGVPITHETHRSRFSFAAQVCMEFLKEFPFLKLTADFAHWTCVSESLLENYREAVSLAIKHTYHIHARVGSDQSPQVLDPRNKNYQKELSHFNKWWTAMMVNLKNSGRSYITVAPEHGPIPYALKNPYTNKDFADQWDVNQFIKSELIKDWSGLKEE